MKLSPEQIKLYKDIGEILWNDWDPINLKAFGDWPNDEYQSYVPTIFSLKNRGESTETIAESFLKFKLLGWELIADMKIVRVRLKRFSI